MLVYTGVATESKSSVINPTDYCFRKLYHSDFVYSQILSNKNKTLNLLGNNDIATVILPSYMILIRQAAITRPHEILRYKSLYRQA